MIGLSQLARALGGEVSGRQVLAPGPGHSQRDRSLSICIEPAAPDGFVVHSFAGDDPLVCKDYARERLGLPAWEPGDGQDRRIDPVRIRTFDRTAINRNTQKRGRTDDDLLRIERAVAIWDKAQDPRGTLAQVYLNDHRKLILDDDLAGSVLRFHPHCPWRNENTGATDHIPALIAVFRSIDDGTITAIHRIALNWPDGAKLGRRMLGPVQRSAVMLDPIGAELAIGEGIETCMAARQLGIKPAWALGSTGSISWFPVIDAVKQLTILGETGKASQDAIQFCTPRWRRAGKRVRIAMPTIGSDLNDELMMEAAQ
jgi:putative DNA primase/helicase